MILIALLLPWQYFGLLNGKLGRLDGSIFHVLSTEVIKIQTVAILAAMLSATPVSATDPVTAVPRILLWFVYLYFLAVVVIGRNDSKCHQCPVSVKPHVSHWQVHVPGACKTHLLSRVILCSVLIYYQFILHTIRISWHTILVCS